MSAHRSNGFLAAAGRLPQLLVSICCAFVAFTGAWLWWLGDSSSARAQSSGATLQDPLTIQLWMQRLHIAAAVLLALVLLSMLLRSTIDHDGTRFFLLLLFGALLGVGAWSGLVLDWDEARLWATTSDLKIAGFTPIGDFPPLPDDLGNLRVHMSFVPVAMLMVAIASMWHYRRS